MLEKKRLSMKLRLRIVLKKKTKQLQEQIAQAKKNVVI